MELKIYEHKAQYYETDQMGIIHHANYLHWFEEARIDMMEQIIMGKQMTLRQAVQQNEALIAKLEKIVPRVGRKDGAPGPNVLSGFIEADVAAKREQNERTKQMIAHGEKLLEYVRTYTFEVEAPPPQPQWVNVTWGTSAGGTASTIS